jgi:ABC-type branched-subunit amino acid transport system ATPase component
VSGSLLTVDAVDAAYGSASVLHQVSLRVDTGEMVFIAGRNGAGKTTLLKTIAGFMTPAAGTVRLEGRDLRGIRPEKVARLGVRYVFQDKRVFSKLTVRENLELAAYPSGERMSDVVARMVSIYPAMEKFLDSKAGGLSGGQRQILLIGRALTGNPKILLVDEPTEGLAAGVIDDIFRLLSEMKGRLSMLIVEQNLPVVARLADRVYVMKEGKIFQELATRAEIEAPGALERNL